MDAVAVTDGVGQENVSSEHLSLRLLHRSFIRSFFPSFFHSFDRRSLTTYSVLGGENTRALGRLSALSLFLSLVVVFPTDGVCIFR